MTDEGTTQQREKVMGIQLTRKNVGLLSITIILLGYLLAFLNLAPVFDAPELIISEWSAAASCYKGGQDCTCTWSPQSSGHGDEQITQYQVHYLLPDDENAHLGLFLRLKEAARLPKSEVFRFNVRTSNPGTRFKIIFCYGKECVDGHAPNFTEEYDFSPGNISRGRDEVQMSVELRRYFCRLYKEAVHGIIFAPVTPTPRGQPGTFTVSNIEFVRRVPLWRPKALEELIANITKWIDLISRLRGR